MLHIDPRFDNAIIPKRDIRFTHQEVAEDFASVQYRSDFVPRAVHLLPDALHVVVELPNGRNQREVARDIIELAGGRECFYIDSMPGEG